MRELSVLEQELVAGGTFTDDILDMMGDFMHAGSGSFGDYGSQDYNSQDNGDIYGDMEQYYASAGSYDSPEVVITGTPGGTTQWYQYNGYVENPNPVDLSGPTVEQVAAAEHDRGEWFDPSSIAAGELIFGGRDVRKLELRYGGYANGQEAVYEDPKNHKLYIDRDGNGRIDAEAIVGDDGIIYARTLPLSGYDIITDLTAADLIRSPSLPLRGPLTD